MPPRRLPWRRWCFWCWGLRGSPCAGVIVRGRDSVHDRDDRSIVVPVWLRADASHRVHLMSRHARRSIRRPVSGARVVLLCLDGASLDVISPAVAAGRLPNFGRLLDRGASMHLATTRPTQPEPVWASVMTGMWPSRSRCARRGEVSSVQRRRGRRCPAGLPLFAGPHPSRPADRGAVLVRESGEPAAVADCRRATVCPPV